MMSEFFQFLLLFQRVEQIMSRTRQTASPNTTEESNSSAVGNVGFLKDCSNTFQGTKKTTLSACPLGKLYLPLF